jgi:hypothetical protein
MRSLAGFRILTSTDETHFSLTPLGESLKSGAPGAARETILAFAGQWAWDGLREVGYSLQTGKTSMSKGMGMELFD